MDFSLLSLSLQFFRRRMHEIQTIINKAKERFRHIGRHLHVKVAHEVTVELPADWKPRRERMKHKTDASGNHCDPSGNNITSA